jgi:DNA-binding PadR family transcriptional regulator
MANRANRDEVSALGYALLALLARRPLTGYDLAQRMRRSTDFFWTARHSQIYPELARMEAAGLLTHEVIQQTERPDKKRYTMTEAGYAALRAWLVQPVRQAPERDEMMLKTFCSWLIEPREAAPIIRAREAEHTARQATYEAMLADLEQHPDVRNRRVSTPAFTSYATLRRGIQYERGYAEWCRWMAETLEAADQQEGA